MYNRPPVLGPFDEFDFFPEEEYGWGGESGGGAQAAIPPLPAAAGNAKLWPGGQVSLSGTWHHADSQRHMDSLMPRVKGRATVAFAWVARAFGTAPVVPLPVPPSVVPQSTLVSPGPLKISPTKGQVVINLEPLILPQPSQLPSGSCTNTAPSEGSVRPVLSPPTPLQAWPPPTPEEEIFTPENPQECESPTFKTPRRARPFKWGLEDAQVLHRGGAGMC